MTPARTSRGASKTTLRVVHKFEDGTQHVLTLEEQVFKEIGLYARMYVSEDAVLRKTGDEKLREVAKIVAQSKSASVFGKLLKEKQIEKTVGKNDNYTRFLDDQQDITDTKRLAARLRKQFGINTVRGSEDRVREWKKNLRSAGAT